MDAVNSFLGLEIVTVCIRAADQWLLIQSRHTENISYQIEWDMIVATVFLSILSQMDFHLVQNREENCHHNHIPFNVKGNGILVFSVYVIRAQMYFRAHAKSKVLYIEFIIFSYKMVFHSVKKSKGKLSPRSYPIQFVSKWNYSFVSVATPSLAWCSQRHR